MDRKTILIVDDDKEVREVIKATLRGENHALYEASSRKRLIEIIADHKLDMILLDLSLTDGNALDLIPILRDKTGAPILILSGSNNNNDKVIGLESGADDYIAKPFRPVELRARIHANLRRLQQITTANSNFAPRHKIRFGSWVLNPSTYRVYNDNNEQAPLTAFEFKLLEQLLHHAGKVLSRYDLLQLTREKNATPCHERAIDIQITRIRKKLGDDTGRRPLIRTVRGAGYMVDCDTEIIE